MNESKAALRKRLLQARAELEDREARQARIDEHLESLPHLEGDPEVVAMFSALPDEASVAKLAARLEAAGRTVAYPRVEEDGLVFRAAAAAELVPGTMGILEPAPDAPAVALESIELFIVPGVGFTALGARIGYGKGYYDRALAGAQRLRKGSPPAPAIGVGFDVQVLDELPVERHDVHLDGLVTESGYVPAQGETPSRR